LDFKNDLFDNKKSLNKNNSVFSNIFLQDVHKLESFKQNLVILWVKDLLIKELKFKITFSKDPSNTNTGISDILGSIGAQFVNIENANIDLEPLKLEFFMGETK